jgi:twitching motility protein PilJ
MAEQASKRPAGFLRQNLLLVVALVALAVGAVSIYLSQVYERRDNGWIDLARQLGTDVGEVARSGNLAAHGLAPDFHNLAGAEANFNDSVAILRNGDPTAGIPPMPAAVSEQVNAVENSWKTMKKSVDDVVAHQDAFNRTVNNIGVIKDGAPKVSAIYDQIAERLIDRGTPSSQIILVAAQVVHLERLQAAAGRVISDGRNARRFAEQLSAELKAFNTNTQTLSSESSISTLVKNANNEFGPVAQAAAAIISDAPAVDSLQTSSALLQGQGTNVLAAANTLEQALDNYASGFKVLPYVGFFALAVAVVTLILFGWLNVSTLRQRQRDTESREAQRQQAILNLLDEITNLANGDLTVDVTVTEEFTGAIADSLNYTVQTLRSLVGTINDTSAEVVAAAASTQNIARQMNEASERQAREIGAVTNSISATSQSLQEVSGRAEKLANQAQTSVQVAHDGASTVGRTIQNMAALREQIQDTAKRIKRLGESSQEIGNITELINDIAEQTNTLALNASIQAAMAGEAGRGFAVVADEVQRLAERATSATRQIENLVKTIQADTNEAIISMERSTANVVAGAKSAEEAGQALTQIESTSQELARLIQEIAAATRHHSAEATKIAGTMQSIREIAVQTSGSAERTSLAVGELNTLSDKLRESVAGFKLPADMAL